MRDHTKIRAFELDNEIAVLIYAEILKVFSLKDYSLSARIVTNIQNKRENPDLLFLYLFNSTS